MEYVGNRHADAEIVINLDKGIVSFDYSLNKFGRSTASNNTCTLQKETSKIKSLVNPLFFYPALFSCLATHPAIIKLIPQYQSTLQKISLWGCKHLSGLQEQQIIGKQLLNNICFYITKNLWFEYELDGDYKDKIKKIELRRRFVKKVYWYGSYFQQLGWNVIFTFQEPPQHGYAILRSVI